MEYNSQKDLLIIPEYGRNIQGLIRHAFSIEDLEKRQNYVERVINLIQQMYPQSRNVKDSKLKLWEHVIRIAEDDLKVTLPEGVSLEEIGYKRPDAVKYPEEINRFRHYGKNVRTMIKKATEMEDGDVKSGYILAIAGYMKMAYRNWHKDLNVSDDVIKGDLKTISNGELTLPDDVTIDVANHSRKRYQNNRHSNSRNHRNNGGHSNNYRNNRNNNRRRY